MNRLEETITVLEDLKAEDISYLDVKDVSSLFDYMLVCTARSSQHARTLADKVSYHFKPEMQEIPKIDGSDTGEWIAVDLDDIVLHIMQEEQRNKYKIEQLWLEFKKHHASDD